MISTFRKSRDIPQPGFVLPDLLVVWSSKKGHCQCFSLISGIVLLL